MKRNSFEGPSDWQDFTCWGAITKPMSIVQPGEDLMGSRSLTHSKGNLTDKGLSTCFKPLTQVS